METAFDMQDATEPNLDNSRARILIVEDSRTQAAMLRGLLERNGYDAVVAVEGNLALEAARETLPRLVISDILMPVMDGFEMCRALKDDPDLETIPVLLLTSLDDPVDIVRGLKAGADYYVTKPFDPEYLLKTVNAIVTSPVRDPHEREDVDMIVEVAGQSHTVRAGRRQMMNLLLSTYSNAVLQNRVLLQTQHELRTLNTQLVAQRQQIEAQGRELREVNALLQVQATRDALTGLRNRRAFMERMNEEMERVRRHGVTLSLIMLDVDRFKQYNDSFGHPAGDEVLREVARLMEGEARGSDFVARYGGEEFAILLPNTESDASRRAAERVRVAIEGFPWQQRVVTASIGVATTTTALDPTVFLAHADSALYAAKAKGRNCIVHSHDQGSV